MRRTLLIDPETISAPRPKRTSWVSVMHSNGKSYKVDGRSVEGRLLRDTRDALLEQLNRKPSPAEKLLIDRLAWLHLCTRLLDSKVLAGTVDFGQAIQYSSQINAFSAGLQHLGLLGASAIRSDDEPGATAPISADASTRAAREAQSASSVEA